MLYICTKFWEIIWNDIKVIEWTWFLYWKFQRGIILQKDTIYILTIYKITKWHKTEKNVEGVTVHNQSLVILYLYQVLWNDLKPYQSYRADTISMPEIKKGNNSANNVSGVTTFNLCKMAGHALYCTKFCEIISNGIKVIQQTPFLYWILQRGIIPPKMQVEQLLLISARRLIMLYISTKFCEIISNGIKVLEWVDRTSILKITKGNNSAKNVGGVTVVNICTTSGHALYFYQVLWHYHIRYQSYRTDTISILENTKGNNSAKNVGWVNVVNLCMSSGHVLYLCQVSWNYLERYQNYRADTISIWKITKGKNSAKNVGGATVVNLCMSSGHALYLCQVSWNNIERYQNYRVDTISIGKITKGDNSAKNAGGATVVNVCTSSVIHYISTKFCEIISNRIKVIERIPFLYWKLEKGNNSEKNVGGVNIVNLCKLSGHALYLCQLSWNYLERYWSYRADTISIWKITKGNNSAKNVGGVNIVNLCKSSGHAYLCQLSWNYLERYQSYTVDTISIRKITKGNNSTKNVGGVRVVNLCKSSGHALYFYQVLWNYLKRHQSYRADTISIRKITKGNNSTIKGRWSEGCWSLQVVWSCFIFLPSFVKLS